MLPAIYRLLRWQRCAATVSFHAKPTKEVTGRLVRGEQDPIYKILFNAGYKPIRQRANNRLITAFNARAVDVWIRSQCQLLADVRRADDGVSLRGEFDRAAEPSTASTAPTRFIPDRLKWQVIQAAELQTSLQRLTGNREKEFQSTLKPLLENPTRRLPAATFDHVSEIRALQRAFPNFRPAIDRIAQQLSLSARLKGPVTVPKLLLWGEPGTGKTEFARRVSEALDMFFVPIALPQVTAGWQLSGLSASWNGGKTGQIVDSILKCPPDQVPLIFFDEICKIAGAHQSPVEPALLQCLEPGTAGRFQDEFLGVPVDLRPIGMMFAANRLFTLRPETLDRLEPIPVRAPTPDEMPEVVKSIDAGIRDREPDLDLLFEPLDYCVLVELGRFRPREVRKILAQTYARVAEAAPLELDRLTVSACDVRSIVGDRHADNRKAGKSPAGYAPDRPATPNTAIDELVADALRRWTPRSTH